MLGNTYLVILTWADGSITELTLYALNMEHAVKRLRRERIPSYVVSITINEVETKNG